jgi:hypothetical protein
MDDDAQNVTEHRAGHAGRRAADLAAPDVMSVGPKDALSREHDHESQAPGAQALRLPLPFDDAADDTIPFVLTAAAHREVFGRQVPALTAVPRAAASVMAGPVGTASPDELVGDTRRVQARALLRSGMPVATIAAALGVRVAEVERWTCDLGDELARRRRRSARKRRVAASHGDAGTPRSASRPLEDHGRLLPGLALAVAQVEDSGVSLVHEDVEVIAILLGAMRQQVDLPAGRVRVAARLAPEVPADRMRVLLADRLGVEPASIIVGRAGVDAGRPCELRVDIRDTAAARLVLSWRHGRAAGLAVEGA